MGKDNSDSKKPITHKRLTPIKKRSQSCYDKKIDRLTKYWERCPKLQAKITLDKWLEQVKKSKE